MDGNILIYTDICRKPMKTYTAMRGRKPGIPALREGARAAGSALVPDGTMTDPEHPGKNEIPAQPALKA